MASKKPDGGVRLGARLDVDTAALLELLAFATNENTGHVIQMALLALFDALPKGQRETISRTMPLRQASLSRLRKACGPIVAESASDTGAGQGTSATTSGSVDSSLAVPALMARTSSITAMFNRTHAPIDEALHEVGGGN
jgi:hypothetical protein